MGIVVLSCRKNKNDGSLCEVQLSVQYTVVPGVAVPNSSFSVRYGCTGSDLCYKFLRSEVKTQPGNIFEIRPIGTYPCKPKICATAIYEAADTIILPTTIPGTYKVNFYSGNTLISSNSVAVN